MGPNFTEDLDHATDRVQSLARTIQRVADEMSREAAAGRRVGNPLIRSLAQAQAEMIEAAAWHDALTRHAERLANPLV